MNSEQITVFLQAHWNFVTLVMGVVFLIGIVLIVVSIWSLALGLK